MLAGLAALPASRALGRPAAPGPFQRIECDFGGRLGIAARVVGRERMLTYRGGERFAMCSTFKPLIAGLILQRAGRGEERLDRKLPYGGKDLLEIAPVTRAHVSEGGMGVGALCEAAVSYSDNTAANLLLRALGGPGAATRALRAFGDGFTRIDREEPDANSCIPGDERDTTTPEAMVRDIHALCFGDGLSEHARSLLLTWLINYKTRFRRLSAGFPKAWLSAHKMGTGANGTVNDVAIAWPPGQAPLIVAAFYTGSTGALAEREAALAEAGRQIARLYASVP